MRKDNTIGAFFALIRAGLFPVHGEGFKALGQAKRQSRANESMFRDVEWEKVYQLAQEQSVQGLLLQGIENLKANGIELSVPKIMLLQWIGEVQIIEQRNKAMNQFIADLVAKMREADIYTLLVKGQGIAQCYEKPQWRTPGDIDFFLSDTNYEKAKSFLKPLANEWYNGNTQVFLPAADEDVFLVFTHFVKHFYKEGGVTLRQICDWCRLLWTYKDSLNHRVLETRIRKAGLMSEWKAFGALAVEYLGMPIEAMPLLDVRSENEDGRCEIDAELRKKAEQIVIFILKGGRWQRFKDTFRVGSIFPLNTFRFLPGILFSVNWLKIKERIFKR